MGSKTTNGSLSLSLIIRSFDSASSCTSVHPILMKGVYSGNLTQHCFDCSVTGTLNFIASGTDVQPDSRFEFES